MKFQISIMKTKPVQFLLCIMGLILVGCSQNNDQGETKAISNRVKQVDSSLLTNQQDEKIVREEAAKDKVERILEALGDPLKVDTLVLSNMNLEEIPDLTRYSNLKYLDLSNNAIEHLNWKAIMMYRHHLYNHKSLEYIDLSNNKIIKGIPFINSYDFPNLKGLNLSNNGLSKFFIKGNGRLNTLDLSSNDLINVQIECQYIDSLNISNNAQLLNVVIDTLSIGYLKHSSPLSYNLMHSEAIPIALEQSSLLKPNDSLQLEYYKKKTYSKGQLPTEMFTLDELKEWANEYEHTFINDFKVQVIYSSDSAFKIYEIIGDCIIGMYDENMFSSHYMHYNLKDSIIISELQLMKIERMAKMPDGKYLIIQYGENRNASGYESYATAELLSLNKDSYIFHTIPMSINLPTTEDGDEFKILEWDLFLTEGYIGEIDEPKIEYNEKDKRLSYCYSHDLIICCGLDTAFRSEGSYLYINGKFIQDKYVQTPILSED